MKKLLLLLAVLGCVKLSGQQKPAGEPLYYFKTANGQLGVRTKSGRVVIPAQWVSYLPEDDFNKPIREKQLHLYTNSPSKGQHSIGKMYDRAGNLLFEPFLYDNGPDYFSEGLTRIVKNGKVGFANRNGDIVIEPQYDYANQFDYGIASYCNGCVWETKGEHAFVKGGTVGYINYKGEEVAPNDTMLSVKDLGIGNNRFLAYQFTYPSLEQQLVDSFENNNQVSKAYFVNHYSKLDSNERRLRFEIVERPSSFYPYYHIKAFTYTNGNVFYGNDLLELNFFADKSGRNFFVQSYEGKKVPFKVWLNQYVKEASAYLKKHPDALYKF